MWRRSRETEASPDGVDYLLDLAAFADNRLDDDETARIAALIARDAVVAEDIAAARALGGAVMLAADAAIISRAEALVDGSRSEARVIAFPAPSLAARPWYSAATWSSLAAAMLLAGWLGFNLGSGLSNAPPFGRSADEASAGELLDPTPLLLRDFTESAQI